MALNKDDVEKAFELIPNGSEKTTALNEILKLISDDNAALERLTRKELYTLEYQKTAERYQSIYTSIWTNFSYMSVVAGAILTFGGNVYPNVSLLAFLALLPLIFWYLVSFIPMNTYGNDTIDRLREIEEIFELEFGADIKHFTGFSKRRGQSSKNNPRVRPAMAIFGGLLITFSIVFGWHYFTNRFRIEVADFNDTKALAERLIPAASDCNTITNNDLTGVDEIGKMIRQGLNNKSLKSLCEFRQGNDKVASKELQRDLAGAINSMIEGPLVCHLSPQSCVGTTFLFTLNSNQKRMYENRQVLEDSYPSIIGPMMPLNIVIPILIFTYLCIILRYLIEVVKTIIEFFTALWKSVKKKYNGIKNRLGIVKDELTLVSIDSKSGTSNEQTVTDELLQDLKKLIWNKNSKLLLRIWNIPDLSAVLWKSSEDKALKIAAIVEIKKDNKLVLVDLNKQKMEELSKSQ